MRLIDADALNEKIEELIGYSLSYKAILNAIDNAETIIPFASVETHDTVNMYCDKDAQIIVEQIRPKGEWITKGYEPYGRCNICNEVCEINNFCGHCGAEMKGGAE